jgi:hypothetical protein
MTVFFDRFTSEVIWVSNPGRENPRGEIYSVGGSGLIRESRRELSYAT